MSSSSTEIAPQPASAVSALAEGLLRIAANPDVDPARVRELYAIHREMQADAAKTAFNVALAKVQAEMPRVKKNGVIALGAGKGAIPFAKWEDVDSVVRPILRAHGFSVTFSEESTTEAGIRWSATWRHVDGHFEQNFITLARDSGPGRNAVQSSASTNSYARRYLTADFVNLISEGADDDGKAAGTKYITEAQADELRLLLTATGRHEGAMLDKFFAGSVRSVDEIEVGQGYIGFKSTLEQLRNAAQKKAT